ncbi:AsmA family protein [Desulfobacterota bacterium M19]
MKKVAKIAGVLAVLLIIVVAGLNIFVKSYLTDARIKTLVVPPVEKALGRRVTVGSIKVSLFSGIIINNFAVKEQDGQTDFLHVRAFKIGYDLLPLLHKQLRVSEILLDSPTVKVIRNRDGSFNFSSFIHKKGKEVAAPEKTAGAAAAVLPFALTVDRIRIVDAVLTVRDAKKELPDTDVKADMTMRVKMGRDFDLTGIDYRGRMTMEIKAVLGKLAPMADVQMNFTPKQIVYTIKTRLDKEKVELKGQVDNYLKRPDILLNITSKRLNLDYLAALPAALPRAEAAPEPAEAAPRAGSKTAIAAALPPLTAHGVIKINQALYKKLTINNFVLPFELKNGIFNIKEMTAEVAGGRLVDNLRLDLNKIDPLYSGDLKLSALMIDKLGQGLGQSFGKMIKGRLQSTINFSGAGFEAAAVKRSLSARADYSLTDGVIQQNPLTEAISALFGLPELKTIVFKDMGGKVKLLKGGQIKLDTTLSAQGLTASTNGTVNLDGALNLPVKINISQALARRIRNNTLKKILAVNNGGMAVKFKIGGSYARPEVALDPSFIKAQARKAVKVQVMNQLNKIIKKDSSKEGGGIKLLKGLFGH